MRMIGSIVLAVATLVEAQPTVAVNGTRVVVHEAALAHIANAEGGSGGQAVLVAGEMLGDPAWAAVSQDAPLESIEWQMPPGTYVVMWWGADLANGQTTIEVVDRVAEVREALVAFVAAWAALRDGATPEEMAVFAAAWAALAALEPTGEELDAALGGG